MHAPRSHTPTRWRRIWRALNKRRSARDDMHSAWEFFTRWGAHVRTVREPDGTERIWVSMQTGPARWVGMNGRDIVECWKLALDHLKDHAARRLA